MRILVHLFVSTLSVLIAAYVLRGVRVRSLPTAVVVAIALGIANTFLRPLLVLITLPVTLLTLGLFLFVINALMILFVAYLVPGFEVRNFGWALLFSLIVSLASSFLQALL